MASAERKPSYDAARRIRWLTIAIVVGVAAYCLFWFIVADRIDDRVQAVLASQAQAGTDVTCTERDVRGFPFRFGLFCAETGVAGNGVTASAGALRTAAQFYAPRTVIGELDAPAQFELADGATATIDWQSARFRVVARQPLPAAASVVLAEPVIRSSRFAGPVAARGAEWHMRVADAVHVDLAGRVDAMPLAQFPGTSQAAPDINLDADVRLDNLVDHLASGSNSLRGVSGTITRLGVVLTQDRGLIVSGPFSVAADGLLNGTFDVRVVDVDGVRNALEQAGPLYQPLVVALAFLPRGGENGDEARATLTVERGQARFGIIPLGTIPPL